MSTDEPSLPVLSERFAGHVREHAITEGATRDALAVATHALDAYKVQANEFRGSLSDQRSEFVTRAEHSAFGARIDALEDDRIARDAERRAELAATADQRDRDRREAERERTRLGLIVSIISIVASVAVAVLVHVVFG